MSSVEVRVGGQRLASVAPVVTDVTDSTVWRRTGWSGDLQASCTWLAPRGFTAPWLKRHAVYEHYEAGVLTWGGHVTEVTPNADGTISIAAVGYGFEAGEYLAVTSGFAAASAVPDTVIDRAHADGMAMTRNGVSVSATAVGTTNGVSRRVSDVLDQHCARTVIASGLTWRVDSKAVLTIENFRQQSTLWQIATGSGLVGTTDEEWYTLLAGWYVKTANADGVPLTWGYKTAENTTAHTELGRREAQVDLTELSVLTSTEAQENVDGRFARVGARETYTNPIELTPMNLTRIGFGGSPTSPLGMYGRFGAGTWLRIPDGTLWERSWGTYLSRVQLGKVTRVHADDRVVAEPVGFRDRGFASALEAAQKPEKVGRSKTKPWDEVA